MFLIIAPRLTLTIDRGIRQTKGDNDDDRSWNVIKVPNEIMFKGDENTWDAAQRTICAWCRTFNRLLTRGKGRSRHQSSPEHRAAQKGTAKWKNMV